MLRASSEIDGDEADIRALIENAHSNVEHGAELLALAEAMVNGNGERIQQAREAVAEAMGAQAMVDAVGVAANFERMVRIADATGIPLDDAMEQATSDVRRELELDRFLER